MNKLADVISVASLHSVNKRALYAMAYGSSQALQEAIDEEGCGAVFCSARLVPD